MWDLPDKSDFLNETIEEDPRYKEEAYLFILDTLKYVIKNLQEIRHITGQELSDGCRRRALELYGPLARSVLEYWGIRNTDDFGEIVFNLIKTKQLSKTETDHKEDFHNVFDFEEAFDRQYPWGKVT
ncbi:MAG: Minf_1886 family protein [Gemmatimonadota bacterium]|nr:Minf_1886 family protein [Gemmatimonadota bacterium]